MLTLFPKFKTRLILFEGLFVALMAALYLLMGVLLLLTVTLFSGQESMRATEDYFARTISFVKVQSTSFEKNNDTITAKALRRMAVAAVQPARRGRLFEGIRAAPPAEPEEPQPVYDGSAAPVQRLCRAGAL